MKKLVIASLVAGQMLAMVQPAMAAAPVNVGTRHAGAFAGLRVRVPLGGPRPERQVRAGLALAPTLQNRAALGETRSQIGEGLEFGYRSGRPASFSIAGRDLNRQGLGVQGDGDSGGPSTLGWTAIVVGGLLVAGAAALAICASSTGCWNSD
jgi:hypothetical protein